MNNDCPNSHGYGITVGLCRCAKLNALMIHEAIPCSFFTRAFLPKTHTPDGKFMLTRVFPSDFLDVTVYKNVSYRVIGGSICFTNGIFARNNQITVESTAGVRGDLLCKFYTMIIAGLEFLFVLRHTPLLGMLKVEGADFNS